METFWLLKGTHEAAGWSALEGDARAGRMNVRLFDRDAWALVCAEDAPRQYAGLEPVAPADGLYLDQQGHSLYLVEGRSVAGPEDVLSRLGPAAVEMLARVGGDADAALERLGRVY